MPRLPNSLRDWQTDRFVQSLKREIGTLAPGTLPLDRGVTQGSYVDDSKVSVSVLSATEDATSIQVNVGIFFTEIVASCGCGDEPTPTHAYCELRVRIDKASAETAFALIAD